MDLFEEEKRKRNYTSQNKGIKSDKLKLIIYLCTEEFSHNVFSYLKIRLLFQKHPIEKLGAFNLVYKF